MPRPLKPCPDCGGEKDPGKGHKWCAVCRAKRADQRRHRRRGIRGLSLLPRHGITVEEYDALAAAQRGKCAICGIDPPNGSRGSRLIKFSVDHDHVTGEIRGLLCNRCNMGLHFLEASEWRLAAETYLSAPPSRVCEPLLSKGSTS